MPYSRSYYRKSFEVQVNYLVKKARRAQRLRSSDADIRDLVFQCTVFLTSAAIESYIRLMIESWIQKVKANNLGGRAPSVARAFIVAKKLEKAFAQYQYNNDEKALYKFLQADKDVGPLLLGNPNLPASFDGKSLHAGSTYPSVKNIKKLFSRVGVENIMAKISQKLSRDAELMIESFQSVRTALAHSAPPTITIQDVEILLADSKALVASIDRIFHTHVMQHGGAGCWTS